MFKIFYFSFLMLASFAVQASLGFIEADFNVKNYNKHLSIETASAIVESRKADFDFFMKDVYKALSPVLGDKVQRMGFRTIHKHYTVEEGTAPVENFVSSDHAPNAYITASSVDFERASPSGWIFNGKNWEVFEYSTDQQVASVEEWLTEPSAVFLAVSKLLLKHNLHDLLSFSILGRDSLDKMDLSDDKKLVEITVFTPETSVCESIVTSMKDEDIHASSTLIPASWALSVNVEAGAFCDIQSYCCSECDGGHQWHYVHRNIRY